MLQQHPGRAAGKCKQAVAAKTGDWSTGRSSSSGEEDKKSKSQEAELKALREQFEWFRKQRGEAGQERKTGAWKWRRSSRMAKTRGSWMSREKGCRRNCETLRSSNSYRRNFNLVFLEGLQQQLQDIEQKRHDLLREHQRVQKRSPKRQSIQDKKRNLHKKMLPHERRCGSSKGMPSKKRSVPFFCRTKSRKMKELKRKWKHNFKSCKQGKKEEVAKPPKGSIAAWKRWQSSCDVSFRAFARHAPKNV